MRNFENLKLSNTRQWKKLSVKDVKYDYVKDISCIIISHGLNSNTDNAQKLYDRSLCIILLLGMNCTFVSHNQWKKFIEKNLFN